ncbi:MAG: DNA-3-methyladenine glycosylase [candidate division Zixibacteria bacterium]|nr:DNA-3-methyladenine glycosylase [candidate division Zixibacteria bacterium]
MPERKLKLGFYRRPTLLVARELIGMVLVDRRSNAKQRAVRIVEVEAYIGEDDPASHAACGPTSRNRIMYGRPGLAYVYLIYGVYNCLNIVTEKDGFPAAVLIRAAEPLEGVFENDTKSGRRHRPDGPGKLCLALGIDRSDNGLDLTDNALYLADRNLRPGTIATSGRIGISAATDRLWRFFDPDSPYISTQRKPRPRANRTTPAN